MPKSLRELKHRQALLVLSLITSIIYILWRIFFTIPTEAGLISLIAGVALVTAETIAVLEAIEHYRNMSKSISIDLPDIPKSWFPDVDILIATHNESTELLYKTINGCLHMNYPYKSKVHIHLCDDMNRVEMKQLADRMGINYFGLEENKHAKAGNLNNALKQTWAPLVVTFDADMIPRSNFLLETVPYFFIPKMEKDNEDKWHIRDEEEDRKIGFIQTPQSFYNPDLFQYNLYSEKKIPNEQDYFFKEVNVGRNRTNSPIYAGSNTVISREALEEVDYIKTGSITEDFATGLEIQNKGYECYATDIPLAHGLSPESVEGLIKQRERWGRGCVQTLKNFKFMFYKGISLGTKMSYFSSLMYWWTFLRRFIYIMSPILFILFHIQVVDTTLIELLIFWLPAYVLYNRALRVISGNIKSQKWSNTVDTIIFPYLIIPIIAESIGFKQRKFAVTDKNRPSDSEQSNIKYAFPHMILIVFTVVALYYSLKYSFAENSIAYLIVIYWLLFNLYSLLMTVFFAVGRKNYRMHERFIINEDIEISDEKINLKGTTLDASEAGVRFKFEEPEYLPHDVDLDVTIKSELYESHFKAKVVHVYYDDNETRYSLHISEIDDDNKKQYLNILFDRDHSLPNYVAKGKVIDDLINNIRWRLGHLNLSQRKLPRVTIDKLVETVDNGQVKIVNFNYEYVVIKSEGIAPKQMLLKLYQDENLDCEYDSRVTSSLSGGKAAYIIKNVRELTQDSQHRNMLLEWLEK